MPGERIDERTLQFAYLFEAKGIQKYIFASGRLRDVVGASDLLARIADQKRDDADRKEDNLVAAVAAQVPPQAFSRHAAGAFCAHFANEDDLHRFRALWRLTIATALPGLEFADAIGDAAKHEPRPGRETSDQSEKALLNARDLQSTGLRLNGAASVLPLGGPATKFAPRTGRPAVPQPDAENEDNAAENPVDSILYPIRRRADKITRTKVAGAADQPVQVAPEYDALARRVLPNRSYEHPANPEHHAGPPLLLPRNLTSDDDDEDTLANPLFPFVGDVRRLAIVHADLSGLGELYGSVQGDASTRRARSQEIEKIVLGAIKAALTEILEKTAKRTQADDDDPSRGAAYKRSKPDNYDPRRWVRADAKYIGKDGFATVRIAPFRAIVAGGDDITFLVRSDLALSFAKTLLKGIEVGKDSKGNSLELSACAGIALVKATTPFLLGHDLAEQLCSFAKKPAKAPGQKRPYPSALAFHEPTGSLGERYVDIVLPNELTAGDVRLTAGPYGLGGKKVGRPLDALLKLVEALKKLKGLGALRELRTCLLDGRPAAEADWKRWRTVQSKLAEVGEGHGLDALDAALKKLDVKEPKDSFLAPVDGEDPIKFDTALFDALILLSLEHERRQPQTAQAEETVG